MSKIGLKMIMKALTTVYIFAAALAVCSAAPDQGATISLALDGVPLENMIRMFTRISGANIAYNTDDMRGAGSVSMNVVDTPWKPVLRAALAEHGFVMVVNQDAPETYRIQRLDSSATAASFRAAHIAVAVSDAVLKDIEAGSLESAIRRLKEYRTLNQQVLAANTDGPIGKVQE